MVGGMSEYYDQSGCTPSRSHSAISPTTSHCNWASWIQTDQLLMSSSLAAIRQQVPEGAEVSVYNQINPRPHRSDW
jgi:hypothetical protein